MKARILIVEDENIIALDMKFQLQELGYEVVDIASFGEEAIEKALNLQPDIVLMDLMLRGKMSGIEAANEINIKNSNIPIVYLTANSDSKTISIIENSYAKGYLSKPIELQKLQDLIEQILK